MLVIQELLLAQALDAMTALLYCCLVLSCSVLHTPLLSLRPWLPLLQLPGCFLC
jgi:hypothetical protein